MIVSVLRAVVLSTYTKECSNFYVFYQLIELISAIQAFEAFHGNATKPRPQSSKFIPRKDSKREVSNLLLPRVSLPLVYSSSFIGSKSTLYNI